MGVYANANVDFAGIANTMGQTLASWLNAYVQIVSPNTAQTEWDVFTNTEITPEPTVVWEGAARIQPLSSYTNPVVGFVEDSVRSFRVNIPLDVDPSAIKSGMKVVVVNPGNDAMLDGMVLNVMGSINSSYAWARTIMCQADTRDGFNG